MIVSMLDASTRPLICFSEDLSVTFPDMSSISMNSLYTEQFLQLLGPQSCALHLNSIGVLTIAAASEAPT